MATRSFLRLKLVAAVQKRQFALVDPVALNACYARCVARARAAAPGCGGPPLSTDLSQDRQYARARARAGGLWVSLPSAFVETCSSPAASVLPHVPPPSARALTLTLSAGLSGCHPARSADRLFYEGFGLWNAALQEEDRKDACEAHN